MSIQNLSLDGIKLISPRIYQDARGYFLEKYKKPLYDSWGLPEFVQDNHSFSKKNVIRGLHFQVGEGQDKLVSVGYGKIFDVVVDIRPLSPTFKRWISVILDEELQQQLFVPKGFAHGFAVLSECAVVSYKTSTVFDPNKDRGFRWDDPMIHITWPITDPIVSEKDRKSPFFLELF